MSNAQALSRPEHVERLQKKAMALVEKHQKKFGMWEILSYVGRGFECEAQTDCCGIPSLQAHCEGIANPKHWSSGAAPGWYKIGSAVLAGKPPFQSSCGHDSEIRALKEEIRRLKQGGTQAKPPERRALERRALHSPLDNQERN